MPLWVPFLAGFARHRVMVHVRRSAVRKARKSLATGHKARLARSGSSRYRKHVRTGSGYRRKVPETRPRTSRFSRRAVKTAESATYGKATYARSYQKGKKSQAKARSRRYYGRSRKRRYKRGYY